MKNEKKNDQELSMNDSSGTQDNDIKNHQPLPEPNDTYIQLKNQFAQLAADFENYKRRSARDQIGWIENAQQKIFLNVLTIVDDFDRALHQQPTTSAEFKSWLDGILLIRGSLQKMLTSYGIEKMTNYDVFDPSMHEAITQVQSEGKLSGSIIDVLQPGYKWKDKVLRPAKVVVAA